MTTEQPVLLTKAGLEKLEAELHELRTVKRAEVAAAIREAQANAQALRRDVLRLRERKRSEWNRRQEALRIRLLERTRKIAAPQPV